MVDSAGGFVAVGPQSVIFSRKQLGSERMRRMLFSIVLGLTLALPAAPAFGQTTAGGMRAVHSRHRPFEVR